MLVNSISVSNPIGAIKKVREYRSHFRFPIDLKCINKFDRQLYSEIFGADESQLHLSLIAPIIDNLIALDSCRLHISPYSINPSFDAICRVDEYVLLNRELPDYCGLKVKLTGEEKVNLMCII